MPVKLQQLLYFVGVAEEGQFTRAAKSLHVAQPALSHAIAHLETQLGVELLERHPRGVSLTAAGERFFSKARLALAAADDAELTARSLMRGARNAVELGFLGSPPMLDAPELFAALAERHSELEVTFRELPFPGGSTAAWLEHVDLALCFSPTQDMDVHSQPLRTEPRMLLAAETHALARRRKLSVADVLDATFPGSHPSVDPVWAGLWQLDDHRGGPAPNRTHDVALSPHELAAIVASGRAVTVTAASNALNTVRALPGVVAIPLPDAYPVTLSLVWHRETPNPRVELVAAAARELGGAYAPVNGRGPQNGAGHARALR